MDEVATRPRYITATLSDRYCTTDRSCEMNKDEKPKVPCRSASWLSIAACIDVDGLAGPCPWDPVLGAQRAADDVSHPHPRVQRRERILEDHVHLWPELPEPATGHVRDVGPVKEDLAAVGVEQAQDAPSDGGLPASRFSHQPHDLTGADRQVHAVHRPHGPPPRARGTRKSLVSPLISRTGGRPGARSPRAPSPRRRSYRLPFLADRVVGTDTGREMAMPQFTPFGLLGEAAVGDKRAAGLVKPQRDAARGWWGLSRMWPGAPG